MTLPSFNSSRLTASCRRCPPKSRLDPGLGLSPGPGGEAAVGRHDDVDLVAKRGESPRNIAKHIAKSADFRTRYGAILGGDHANIHAASIRIR